jgi:hypothetical protein
MVELGFLCKVGGGAEWVRVKRFEWFSVKHFIMAGWVAVKVKPEGLGIKQFLVGGGTEWEGWFVRRQVVRCRDVYILGTRVVWGGDKVLIAG